MIWYRKMSSMFDRDDVNKAIALATLHLGYVQLRPEQLKAVREFAHGSDVFVSLPTSVGFLFAEKGMETGKCISLVFACPVE